MSSAHFSSTVPGEIPYLNISTGIDIINLKWGEPVSGGVVHFYNYCWAVDSVLPEEDIDPVESGEYDSEMTPASVLETTITRLTPHRVYSVNVSACNNVTCGPIITELAALQSE